MRVRDAEALSPSGSLEPLIRDPELERIAQLPPHPEGSGEVDRVEPPQGMALNEERRTSAASPRR
jgi:hypothetical protein